MQVSNTDVRRVPAGVAMLVIAASGVAVSGAGCGRGPDAEDTAALAGRVLIDGAPVQKGGIQFMPVERGRPSYSTVTGGAYAARVPRGRVRVIVSAVQETGRQVQVYSTTRPEVIDVVPDSLREGIEVTVDGDDPARDFNLSSARSTAP